MISKSPAAAVATAAAASAEAAAPTPSENPVFSQKTPAQTPTPSENPLFSQKTPAQTPAALKAPQIRLLFTDIDGCLTDGKICYTNERAEEFKAFSVLDGAAIKRAAKQGRVVVFISGRDSAPLRARARDLGVAECALGCKDKLAAAQQIAAKYGASLATEAAMLGDDLIDLALLKECAYAFVPADARALFGHRLGRAGGAGCFFEMLEFLCSLGQ